MEFYFYFTTINFRMIRLDRQFQYQLAPFSSAHLDAVVICCFSFWLSNFVYKSRP